MRRVFWIDRMPDYHRTEIIQQRGVHTSFQFGVGVYRA